MNIELIPTPHDINQSLSHFRASLGRELINVEKEEMQENTI